MPDEQLITGVMSNYSCFAKNAVENRLKLTAVNPKLTHHNQERSGINGRIETL